MRWRDVSALVAVAGLAACRSAPPGDVTPDPRVIQAEEAARRAVATEASLDVDSLPPRSVGVTPFEVNAADTSLVPLGYGLADLLMTDLARSRQLQVVDRLRLSALLREIELVESGRVDATTAPRVGKLLGARRLVLGSLTQRPGAQIRIGARVADVATGDLRVPISASTALDDILEAEKALAFELFDRLDVNLSPAERAAVEQVPTRNLAALLAYSRGVRFEVEGRYGAAAREYQEAVRLDPGFSAAQTRVSEVQAAAPAEAPAEASGAQGSSQVDRAAGLAVERTNAVFPSPVGGAQTSGPEDPSFAPSAVTVVIIVTTPP